MTIYPRDYALAIRVGVQPLVACSQAVLDQPSADLPLGCIKYNFRGGLRSAFQPLNLLIKEAYVGMLVILEVQDFLDGRVVTMYGYLAFRREDTFVVQQAYHFKDAARMHPSLLSYCFYPRIPADPFNFVSTYPDYQRL